MKHTSCGKVRYRSKRAAGLALSKILTGDLGPGKKPCRFYWCPACKGWHLTSQAKRRTL